MADIAATLAGWSSTTGSNAPSGGTTIGTGLDDNLREIQGVIVRGLSHKGADIASATTTDIGAIEGLAHDITGTTTITGLGTVRAGIWKVLKFEGALTLTHNATSLILPGGANITTADGDVAIVISEGSGNWRCASYVKASGKPIAGASGAITSSDFTMTTARLLGRTTASTGAIEELTAAQVTSNFVSISGLAEDVTPDVLADFLVMYDDSAAANTKVRPYRFRATQAQAESGTSNDSNYLTPTSVNWCAGVAKGWVAGGFAGTADVSHNLTSLTDAGTGIVDVNWNTDFSTANYCVVADCQSATNLYALIDGSSAPTAGVTRVAVRNTGTGTLTDATKFYCAALGDQ